MIPNFFTGLLSGSVKINGEDIIGKQPHELSKFVGSVFQNPKTQFFNTDTDSELVFGMENLGIEYEEMHKRYEMTVEDLKLQKLCGKNIFSLSGGEKQSIAFGGVYALSPEIYVLDEPSANLDKKAVKNLEKTLLRLKNKGKTIIVSEHRLYYLKDIGPIISWMPRLKPYSFIICDDLLTVSASWPRFAVESTLSSNNWTPSSTL